QCACFAMVCHHCGLRYIEFFPSARQENLFIGMLHGFSVMGVPKKVYTDNMKSVVVRRLADGTPVWNKDYEAFQKLIGFKTSLHKVAHPWSKVLKTTEFNQNRPLILTKRNITDFNQNMAECSRNTIISLSLAI
ncbi:MAG: hypothetical protein KIG75_05550, partial [Bacteroidales bacterium]|nr:hypothetical protein [Bacteroidales bacterium]